MEDVVCHLVTDIVSFVCVPNKLEKRVEGKMSKILCILYNPHVREADYGSIRFYSDVSESSQPRVLLDYLYRCQWYPWVI